MSLKSLHETSRSLLNKNTAIVTIVTLCVMLWTANDIIKQVRAAAAPQPSLPNYFYDVAENRLFVSTSPELSPIKGPGSKDDNDRTAVRAFVFACGDCSSTKDRFVGWVEAYTPEAKAAYAEQAEKWAKINVTGANAVPFNKEITKGHMVAVPDANNPDWTKDFVPYNSPAGVKIQSQWAKACGSGFPRQCFP